MSIPISVVVCTRNRADSLRGCVQALAAVETAVEWELVIVDNGSTDGTSTFLGSLPKQVNKARVVVTSELKRGLAAARNKGLSESHADIIAFTDDDCYVAKDYIDAMISAFGNGPEIGFVGGRILLFDQSDLRITIQEHDKPFVLQPRTVVAAGTIQGANLAFRRSALERIGGFDEDLGAGTSFACEDIDAVAAALWAGIAGAYDPRPTVYHHHGRKTKSEAGKLFKVYDKGRGAYYAKYILRNDSRSQFVKFWIESFKREMREAFSIMRQGGLPVRSVRELGGGLHYIAARLLKGRY